MTIEIIYTTDSASSIISAALIKNLLKKQQVRNAEDDVIFREVDSFFVSDKTDTYLWLGLPPLAATFTGDALKSFRKAKHYTVNDSTQVYPGSPINVWFAQMSEDLGLSMKTIYEAEAIEDPRYPADVKKMPLGTTLVYEDKTLYYGPIMRALSQLWEIFPTLEIPSDVDFLFQISQFERLVYNFYFRPGAYDLGQEPKVGDFDITGHLISDVIATWTLVNYSLKTLGEEYNKMAEAENFDWHGENYVRHFRDVRQQIQKQMDYRRVTVVDQNHKEKIVTVLTTRLKNDFWLGRRVILMGHKYFHNTRHVTFGLHTTNNLPAGNKGIVIRNFMTVT